MLKPDGLLQLGDFAYPKSEFQMFADAINGGAEFVVPEIRDRKFSLPADGSLPAE